MNTFSKLLEFGTINCGKDEKSKLFFCMIDLKEYSTEKTIIVDKCNSGGQALLKLLDKVQHSKRSDREALRSVLKKAIYKKADKEDIRQLKNKIKVFEEKYNYLIDN